MVPDHQAKERLVRHIPTVTVNNTRRLTLCYSLATVNAFLFCVGFTQVTRIFIYRQSVKGTAAGEEAKEAAKEQVHVVEGVAKDPAGAAKAA
jgi:hypothetical protein